MDLLNILTSDFNWCPEGKGISTVFTIIKTCLNVIRIAVPIILILMTVLDVSKNVINSEEKNSMKKIGTRLIAAVIIFLVPTIVNIIMGLVDLALGQGASQSGTSLSECWKDA